MADGTIGLRHHLLALSGLFALVCLVTWPLARDPGHLFPPHHDPYLFTWVMLSSARNLLEQPAALMQANAFYPGGNALTFSEPLIAPGLLAEPIWEIWHNPVLAYNLTLLVFWAASGWLMYVLAFRLLRGHAAALVSAVIFTASAYRTAYYVEFPMELVYGLPLAVYFLIRYAETPQPRFLAGVACALLLQALSVWYYTVITTIGLAMLGAHVVLLRWRSLDVRAVATAGLVAACLLVALIPLAAPYFHTRSALGFERHLSDAEGHSADVLTYLDTGPNRWYHFDAADGMGVETALFPGFAALALGGWGVMAHRRAGVRGASSRIGRWTASASRAGLLLVGVAAVSLWGAPVGTAISLLGVTVLAALLVRSAREGRRWCAGNGASALGDWQWIRAIAAVALLGFLLSLGPVVHVAGTKAGAGLFGWLYPWSLPLHAIRVATRIGVLVVFAVALLAGFGARALLARVPSGRLAFATILPILVAVEYLPSSLPYVRVDWTSRPAVYRLLERVHEDASVLELPMTSGRSDTMYMFYALGHGKRLVNGFSGFVPPWTGRIQRAFERCGRDGACGQAEHLVRRLVPTCYVVLHDEAGVKLRAALDRAPWATAVADLGDARLYRVTAAASGSRVERVFSWDYARSHGAIRLPLPPDRGGSGDRRLRVRLNGHLVAESALTVGPHEVEVRIGNAQLRPVRENRLVLTVRRSRSRRAGSPRSRAFEPHRPRQTPP